MTPRGRALRYTAISALVVLSLTGFSTGRHGHGGDAYKDDDDTYGSGGSGHHDYDDTDGDGTGGGDTDVMSATLELIACATESEPYATVEVTNPNDGEYTFPVAVRFIDVYGTELTAGHEEATVPAGGVTEVRIPSTATNPRTSANWTRR
ncbi:hypothetical protein G3I32_35685 [Streptomyces coelicoflavus]|uniref:DUF4232 domain-containing protein n=1 Tax=Streptomyces coelicoflavus TaxID=285562 RepID=A0A7K3PXR6_9ACTN|nr:hypothetical protein [Streptomyces coelicoflavus]NEB14111.1 hypothetical protein [Streptomyces coelicoflavus]